MKTLVAILIIGLILLVALSKGVNGTLLATGIGIIAGLGGYNAAVFMGRKKS